MSAADLLRELRTAGIQVGVDERGLFCRGALSPELQAQVRQFKSEMTALVEDPYLAVLDEVQSWPDDVKCAFEDRLEEIVAAGSPRADAFVALHEMLRDAAHSPAPSTVLAEQSRLALEEFAHVCRGAIGRPAPSTRAEDLRVTTALLRRTGGRS